MGLPVKCFLSLSSFLIPLTGGSGVDGITRSSSSSLLITLAFGGDEHAPLVSPSSDEVSDTLTMTASRGPDLIAKVVF